MTFEEWWASEATVGMRCSHNDARRAFEAGRASAAGDACQECGDLACATCKTCQAVGCSEPDPRSGK